MQVVESDTIAARGPLGVGAGEGVAVTFGVAVAGGSVVGDDGATVGVLCGFIDIACVGRFV